MISHTVVFKSSFRWRCSSLPEKQTNDKNSEWISLKRLLLLSPSCSTFNERCCWGFIHKNSEQDLTIFTWFIPYIDFLRNVRLVKVIICRIEIRTTWLPFLFILLSLVLSQSVIIYVWDNDNCGLTKDKCKTKVGSYIYFVLINLQGTSDSKISTNEE